MTHYDYVLLYVILHNASITFFFFCSSYIDYLPTRGSRRYTVYRLRDTPQTIYNSQSCHRVICVPWSKNKRNVRFHKRRRFRNYTRARGVRPYPSARTPQAAGGIKQQKYRARDPTVFVSRASGIRKKKKKRRKNKKKKKKNLLLLYSNPGRGVVPYQSSCTVEWIKFAHKRYDNRTLTRRDEMRKLPFKRIKFSDILFFIIIIIIILEWLRSYAVYVYDRSLCKNCQRVNLYLYFFFFWQRYTRKGIRELFDACLMLLNRASSRSWINYEYVVRWLRIISSRKNEKITSSRIDNNNNISWSRPPKSPDNRWEFDAEKKNR